MDAAADGGAGPSKRRRAEPTGVPRLSVRPVEGAVACQRCHHRKKKCDRERPACGGCSRVKADCVYDIAITDRTHPGFVASLLKENAELRERLAAMEQTAAWMETERQPAGVQVQTVVPTPPMPVLSVPSDAVDLFPTLESPRCQAESQAATHGPATVAERLVCQVLTTEMGMSLRGVIGQQLGASEDDVDDGASSTNSITAWPPKQLALKLTDLFFEYHILFYPIYTQQQILRDLEDLYGTTAPAVPSPSTFAEPDYRIFRLFIIMALGCNLLETERKDGHGGGTVSAVTGMVTFAQYCILDFGRTSPYHVAGIVARFALALGLHKDDPSLSLEEQDVRRRVFYTVYNVDRVVAVSLTKPVAIPDDIVTVQYPTAVPALLAPRSYLDPAEWFRQAMQMRRLSGIILNEVYLSPRLDSTEEREQVLVHIHNLVDDWYHGIPRDVNGECVPLFELFFNVLLTNLYRPSPLFNSTHPLRMVALRKTAYRTIQLFRTVRNQRGLAENYVHLATIVTVAVTLVYTMLEADGDPRNLALSSWRREALSQLAECEQLLANFCINWPGVNRFCDAFNRLANEVRVKIGEQPAPQPRSWGAVFSAGATLPLTDFTITQPAQPSPQFSDQELWDAWSAPSLLTEADVQMALSGIGVDALLASVGLDGFAGIV